MSQFNEGRRRTFPAGAGLTAAQFKIVKLNGSGAVVLASSATDVLIGIMDNQPVTNDMASVTLRNAQGTAKVQLGVGGCAIGAKLTCDAFGTAIVTSTAGNELIGIACQAGNAGDVVEVMLAHRAV